MSDFIDLCMRRQSCRKFADKPVEREKLEQCVAAARLAPSGCNAQPWSFVTAVSPEQVAEVAKAAQASGSNGFTSDAKAFFVVIEEYARLMPAVRRIIESQYFAKADVGAATAYLCLEAEEQGLGTCQIGLFDREAIANALDIPVDKHIAALIAVGYAADDKVRDKVRKPLEEISRFV